MFEDVFELVLLDVFEDVFDEVLELVFEDVFELVLDDVFELVFEDVLDEVFELVLDDEFVLWANCTPCSFATGAFSTSRTAACAANEPAAKAATLAKVEIVMVFMKSLHQ